MTRVIKVAVLAEEPIGWGSGKHYFPLILDGYTWKSGGRVYRFSTSYIFDRDILRGGLNTSNYDVLLVPGGGVGDGESVVKGFTFLPSVRRWKREVKRFIESGGGYVGICGGTALLTGLDRGPLGKPTSFLERVYAKSRVDATCIDSYYEYLAFPLFYPFQRNHPENIGATGYVFSFAPGETVDGKFIHTGGVPIDYVVSKDNPIFSDYSDKTIRMRWWGGPGLVIPSKVDREIKIIARYPSVDFSKTPGTSIKAWRYIGGLIGLTKAFKEASNLVRMEKDSLVSIPLYTYYLAKPWEPTDKNIVLNFSDKPCMISEIYPNENKGRILLCTAHPEYMIWWGGYIEEVEFDGENSLARGFHRWREIDKLSRDAVEEITYTWWVVRRITAWVAKVPDDDLPPIERREEDAERARKLHSNIFWDGTLINQMKNI
ncbi:MAG TPA: hypothetical protein ENG62_00860 [Thermoplasmatales archaeon]|nr:hypothetical protein [Thermoplasmatales archaeon]